MGVGNIANTGLHAAMTNMEAISNNITNVNTVGFKKSTVNFSDIYSGSTGSKSQPGLGVQIASISQDFSSSGTQFTGRGLDLSLNNDGFFVQKNSNTGQVSYTRNGQLNVDKNGYLVSAGGRMQGYAAVNGQIMGAGALVDLKIPDSPIPANPTSTSSLTLNLDSNSVPPTSAFSITNPSSFNYRSDSTIYDSLGQSHTLSVFYVNASSGNWTTQIAVDDVSIGSGSMAFQGNGALASATGMTGLSWSPTTGANTPQALSIDLTGSSQFAASNGIQSNSQDGYPAGSPIGFSFDGSGIVNVSYSNGSTQVAGQVAVATFIAPQGLAQSENMSWLATSDSGNPILNVTAGDGAINAGTLELSNVDLTEELVSLMGAQHDFQASAQVAKTYNQVLQTIEQM